MRADATRARIIVCTRRSVGGAIMSAARPQREVHENRKRLKFNVIFPSHIYDSKFDDSLLGARGTEMSYESDAIRV